MESEGRVKKEHLLMIFDFEFWAFLSRIFVVYCVSFHHK
jgi:hypothetical protein